MHYFQEVFNILKKASIFGNQKVSGGAILFGRVAHIGPEAWLHTVYSPLDSLDIDLLEKEIGLEVPESFREFLELSNGINVFSDSLSIDGWRPSFNRSSDERQPYSIVTPNLYERPPGLQKEMLLVGGYSYGNGYCLYIDPRSEFVFQCSRSDARPLKRWESFGEMLVSEVRRLDELFDGRGRLRDPNAELVILIGVKGGVKGTEK
jgi:SMI1 / KNR4 family (SUKH-1)